MGCKLVHFDLLFILQRMIIISMAELKPAKKDFEIRK